MSQSWKLLCKFIIAGDPSVGKSSLLVRLTEDRFILDQTATIGVEYGSHIIPLENGETIKIQVWDTAGSEQFRSITRSYYRGAAGALLVYSVAHRPSFENVKMWLEDVRSHAEESVSIVLVGNQLDLCRDDDDDDEESQEASTEEDQATEDAEEENESNDKESDSKQRKSHTSNPSDTAKKPKKKRREVSTKEAKEFAEKEGIMFVETSAKTGQNVEEAFTITAKDIHSKFLSKNPSSNSNSNEGSVSASSAVNRRSGARAKNGSLSLSGQDGEGGKNGCCVLM